VIFLKQFEIGNKDLQAKIILQESTIGARTMSIIAPDKLRTRQAAIAICSVILSGKRGAILAHEWNSCQFAGLKVNSIEIGLNNELKALIFHYDVVFITAVGK
jgi:hypothetical protein